MKAAPRALLQAGLLGSLLAALTGCGAGRRPPAPPLPRDAGALAARRPPLVPFRAELKGKLTSPGARGRFRAGLGAVSPDFRLDIFHPVTGSTLLTVGMRQGRLRAVWPAERECLEAPATSQLLADLVGLEVAPDEWLPLLTGHVWPDGPAVEIVSARHPPMAVAAGEGPAPGAGDRLLVTAREPVAGVEWQAELLAERSGLALRATRRGADGREILVEYPRWRQEAASAAPDGPERIVLRAPQRRLRLELEVIRLAAGGPAPGELLPPRPPGCREMEPADLAGRTPFAAVDTAGEP